MKEDKVFEELDRFIAYYKKAKDGQPPPVLRINKKQAAVLKKWFDEREGSYQEKVAVDSGGNIAKYKGVEVRVQ